MADKRKEAERPEVDGWTTSGYGLVINGKPVTPVQENEEKEDTDEIDEV
jgi:hypothetical protein